MFIFKTWVLLPKASALERVTFCLVWNSMCQYSCYAHGNFLLNGNMFLENVAQRENALSKHSEKLKERAAIRFCFRICLQSLFICLASHAVQYLGLEDTLFLPLQELNTNELIQLPELSALIFWETLIPF